MCRLYVDDTKSHHVFLNESHLNKAKNTKRKRNKCKLFVTTRVCVEPLNSKCNKIMNS